MTLAKKYVIFGAGTFGRRMLSLVPRDEVAFFVDNDAAKEGSSVEGIPVRWFGHVAEALADHQVVIAVSGKYLPEIVRQLSVCGLSYQTLQQIEMAQTREKILQRPDYLGVYRRAIDWIAQHHLEGRCIINSTTLPVGYPEVTGYYIPTLLTWGYRELAASFGKWLCDIQKPDGSWYDTQDRHPYVFDSGQILKGLMAIKRSMRETGLPFAYEETALDDHILRGIDWILSNMQPDGRLTTPSEDAWGDARMCTEVVHIYCLEPIVEAADVYERPEYRERARKILAYYLKHDRERILHFDQLSHFYSYVMEALVDLGETELAREAMQQTAALQAEIGFVPAYPEVHWCCSTGLFQQALVWYKLGDRAQGDKAFAYACKLQNPSGGWYGSYPNPAYPAEEPDYFPDGEIAWAVKYFLDALYWKNRADFNAQSGEFFQTYPKTDGRYQEVREAVAAVVSQGGANVLDVGCGKGAYLHNLLQDVPALSYAAVDISTAVMTYICDAQVEQRQGSLTQIPFPDDTFDLTYTTEALEHAVDIESAIREMCRVTKPGGTILGIDKDKANLGRMEICEWEQWFDVEELRQLMGKYCVETWVKKNISYDGQKDGLFCAWYGKIKKQKGD